MRSRLTVLLATLCVAAITTSVEAAGESSSVPLPKLRSVWSGAPVAEIDRWDGLRGAHVTSVGKAVSVRGAGVTKRLFVPTGATPSFAVAVRGEPSSYGQLVRAAVTDPATGRRSVSAPVLLQPWWQWAGVTGPAQGGRMSVGVVRAEGGTPWAVTDGFQIAGGQVSIASVTPSSTFKRQLLVNGSVFTMKGTNYFPVPPGYDLANPGPNFKYWDANPAQCQQDAQAMKSAGMNAARVHIIASQASPTNTNLDQCMDAFATNGIYVMWYMQPDALVPWTDPNWVSLFQADLLTVINRVKAHSITIGYVIGNEVQASVAANQPTWFSRLQTLATYVKQQDPSHVTTTSLTSGQLLGYQTWPGVHASNTAPAIDLWGLNKYWNPNVSQTFWSQILSHTKNAQRNRPVWLSEWGLDRYKCIDWQVHPDPGTCRGSGYSYDDHTTTYSWITEYWIDIAAQLSASNPNNGPVIGGANFGWTDQWWFALYPYTSENQVTSPSNHEAAGFPFSPLPDGYANHEFFGTGYAQSDGVLGLRVTTRGVDALGNQYTGIARPVISNITCPSITPTSITVSWTTNMSVFPMVNWGVWTYSTTPENWLVYDNVLPDSAQQGATQGTSHSFTISNLTPSTNYLVFPRSIHADGRIGSANPVWVGTPASGTGGPCFQFA